MSTRQETLADFLRRLLERLKIDAVEEAVRQGAVLPILSRLGWDRDDTEQVVPEFRVGNGRVDYCLKINNQSIIFIEVKRGNQDLNEHQKQLLKYAFEHGIKIAILTNGFTWLFYLPLSEGSWEQRKFYTIDIRQQEIQKVVLHFQEFLSHDAVASGSAIKCAEKMQSKRNYERLFDTNIPKAWRELCEEPDELLVDLLAEKVESICGLRPDQERLSMFLTSIINKPITQISSLKPEPTGPRPAPEGFTGRKPKSYSFKGRQHSVRNWKDVLVELCKEIHSIHNNEFERVLKLRGTRKLHFSHDPRDLYRPVEISDSGIYVDTVLSADAIMKRCHSVLNLFGYSPEELVVEYRD